MKNAQTSIDIHVAAVTYFVVLTTSNVISSGKKVWQGNTRSDENGCSYGAKNLIDGKFGTGFECSCISTNHSNKDNWWAIDLDSTYCNTSFVLHGNGNEGNHLEDWSLYAFGNGSLSGDITEWLTEKNKCLKFNGKVEKGIPYTGNCSRCGRYMVLKNGGKELIACELTIYDNATDTSLSLVSTARSAWGEHKIISTPSKLNDGNVSTCIQTPDETTNWWAIDLASKFCVAKIILHRHAEIKIKDWSIYVLDIEPNNTNTAKWIDEKYQCYSMKDDFNEAYHEGHCYRCGRYVVLKNGGSDRLVACELEVYGSSKEKISKGQCNSRSTQHYVHNEILLQPCNCLVRNDTSNAGTACQAPETREHAYSKSKNSNDLKGLIDKTEARSRLECAMNCANHSPQCVSYTVRPTSSGSMNECYFFSDASGEYSRPTG